MVVHALHTRPWYHGGSCHCIICIWGVGTAPGAETAVAMIFFVWGGGGGSEGLQTTTAKNLCQPCALHPRLCSSRQNPLERRVQYMTSHTALCSPLCNAALSVLCGGSPMQGALWSNGRLSMQFNNITGHCSVRTRSLLSGMRLPVTENKKCRTPLRPNVLAHSHRRRLPPKESSAIPPNTQRRGLGGARVYRSAPGGGGGAGRGCGSRTRKHAGLGARH